MDSPLAIVTDLAAAGPRCQVARFARGWMCGYCGSVQTSILHGDQQLTEHPDLHEAGCLWRRAMEMVGVPACQ